MSEASSRKPLLQRLGERLTGGSVRPEREIFLCTGPDCCRREAGLAAWKHLRQRLKDEGLAQTVAAHRTACMNVCGDGPIAVVYPERTFYEKMDARGIDAVLEGHLKHGRAVAQHAFEPPDDVKEPPHRTGA